MSRARKLTDEQALELFEMSRKGYSNEDMAKKFGITPQTVGTYCRRVMRERLRQQGSGPRTVSESDGATLTFSVDDGYVGHLTVNGVEETCTFKEKFDSDATKAFGKWVSDMRAEEEFMAKVERRAEPAKREPVAKRQDDDVIYTIVAEKNVGRIYGHYFDFDAAMAEVDRLNDVAEFLGTTGAFDVVEAPVRG